MLIAWDEADPLVDQLCAMNIPNLRVLGARDGAELEAGLAESPEVVYTINSAHFGREAHGRIKATDSVKWLHVGGSGVDHVGGWEAGRLTVTNSAGLLAPYLAETCMGALLAINHGLLEYRDYQAQRRWKKIPFRPLEGQTLLVVGIGEIGRRFARLAQAANMRVIGIRNSDLPVEEADEIRTPDRLIESLGDVDVVSSHLRLTPETAGIFGAEAFAAMRPGSIFMNTGRGGLVDEPALLGALDTHLRGAYLDVFSQEPLPVESPLWAHPRLFMTPHASDGVFDWEARFSAFFGENLQRWIAGEELVNRVPAPG